MLNASRASSAAFPSPLRSDSARSLVTWCFRRAHGGRTRPLPHAPEAPSSALPQLPLLLFNQLRHLRALDSYRRVRFLLQSGGSVVVRGGIVVDGRGVWSGRGGAATKRLGPPTRRACASAKPTSLPAVAASIQCMQCAECSGLLAPPPSFSHSSLDLGRLASTGLIRNEAASSSRCASSRSTACAP